MKSVTASFDKRTGEDFKSAIGKLGPKSKNTTSNLKTLIEKSRLTLENIDLELYKITSLILKSVNTKIKSATKIFKSVHQSSKNALIKSNKP